MYLYVFGDSIDRTAKKKNRISVIFVTSLMLLVCLCILGMFIPVTTARDAFAPSWLKEGTYVKYDPYTYTNNGEPNYGSAGFFDLANPKFAGTNFILSGQPVDAVIKTINSSLVWRCVSVNSTMAKLQVTLDYVGNLRQDDYEENSDWIIGSPERASIQRTVEVYVDLYNRSVYNVDGVFLGITHLWLPANPNDGQEIIVWEEGSEIITVRATISDRPADTIQGQQEVFQLDPTHVTIKNGPQQTGGIYYDLDTGLYVSGRINWDPILAAVGIQHDLIGIPSETNINLGPEHSETNWIQMLYYAIIPVAIIIIVVALVIKRRKKKN